MTGTDHWKGRLMSVSLTEQAVRDRTKTVTRRNGWWTTITGHRMVSVGDRLQLCRKVMGRQGAPLVKIALVEVVDVRRERLDLIDQADVDREGLPMTPAEFVEFFCATHKGVTPTTVITRIEWRYLEAAPE